MAQLGKSQLRCARSNQSRSGRHSASAQGQRQSTRFEAHFVKLGGMDNRFVIGLEYSKTDFRTQRRFSDGWAATDAALQVSALNPSVGGFNNYPALASGAGNRTDMSTGISTTSFFAEDALKLNPAWSVVAGVRTDRIRLERNVDDLNTGTNSSFKASYNSNSVRSWNGC